VALRAASWVFLDRLFESPPQPKTGGPKTEQVICTIPSAPPEDSFKSSMLQIPACNSLTGLMFFDSIAA
jgi:hypothetical protein